MYTSNLTSEDMDVVRRLCPQLASDAWRYIPEQSRRCCVCSSGQAIILFSYTAPRIRRVYPDRIMNFTVDSDGYLKVSFSSVHRCVAKAFLNKPEGCDVVNHLNGIKQDNRADNLEWTTSLANTRHFYTADCFTEARKLHSLRQSVAQKGHTHTVSDTTRLNMSVIHRAENLKPEIRAAISAGLRGRKLSEKSKAKIGAKNAVSQLGKIFINNGVNERRINATDIIPPGWSKGRISRVWVTDGQQDKLVAESQVSSLLQQGYVRGRRSSTV